MQGLGGVAPYKKMGVLIVFVLFYSVHGVGGVAAGGGIGGPPIQKMRVFFFSLVQGVVVGVVVGGWPKTTSPPQEVEVGARRVPYLLV